MRWRFQKQIKSILVMTSVHHDNTKKIVDAIATAQQIRRVIGNIAGETPERVQI